MYLEILLEKTKQKNPQQKTKNSQFLLDNC